MFDPLDSQPPARTPRILETMKKILSGLGLAVGLASGLAAQNVWSDELLESKIEGFRKSDTLSSLQTLSSLLEQQKDGFVAICNRIHGNHAEYLLRIEKLLDELSNERWEIREKAEGTLGEIGAKGKELIQLRAKEGETAEEKIRAARALAVIESSTDTKERTEKQYLRGLTMTALYMDTHPKLVKALVSALQHTDPLIVDHAARPSASTAVTRRRASSSCCCRPTAPPTATSSAPRSP